MSLFRGVGFMRGSSFADLGPRDAALQVWQVGNTFLSPGGFLTWLFVAMFWICVSGISIVVSWKGLSCRVASKAREHLVRSITLSTLLRFGPSNRFIHDFGLGCSIFQVVLIIVEAFQG
jgi:hypothetical protein